MSNINKDILKKASQNVIGKFKIPIRNLTLRLIRDNKEINLINTRSVFYDFINNRFEDPNSEDAQEFIETINNIFNTIYGQTVLSLETFNEYKKQINRNFYSDFSPANQGDSKEEIDPDMLELLKEYKERVRKEKEKAKAPKMLRSLTHDDDAELFTAILPDEDGNSPINSDEISNILDTEGFDAAVKKARKVRKSKKKGGKRRKKRKTRRKTRRKRHKKRKTRRKKGARRPERSSTRVYPRPTENENITYIEPNRRGRETLWREHMVNIRDLPRARVVRTRELPLAQEVIVGKVRETPRQHLINLAKKCKNKFDSACRTVKRMTRRELSGSGRRNKKTRRKRKTKKNKKKRKFKRN